MRNGLVLIGLKEMCGGKGRHCNHTRAACKGKCASFLSTRLLRHSFTPRIFTMLCTTIRIAVCIWCSRDTAFIGRRPRQKHGLSMCLPEIAATSPADFTANRDRTMLRRAVSRVRRRSCVVSGNFSAVACNRAKQVPCREPDAAAADRWRTIPPARG